MASFLDKVMARTATYPVHKEDLSCQHVTTFDWMTLQPIYYRHLIPEEKLELNGMSMVRLNDMPVPTYGRADLHVRAFFVPYRTIFPGWEDFITDSIHTPAGGTTDGLVQPMAPSIPNLQITQYLRYPECSTAVTPDEDGNVPAYDFRTDEQGDAGYVLTTYGRQVLKILNSLGYRPCFNDTEGTFSFSALPLLAFLRVYLDYYFPRAYYDRPARVALEEYVKKDTTTVQVLLASDLQKIFNNITTVPYDSDYFTSAFDNPAGPNSSNTVSEFSITDYTMGSNTAHTIVKNNSNQTAYAYGVTSNGLTQAQPYYPTQFAIDALKKLTDFLKRNQLVGNRAAERMLARFGVDIKDHNHAIMLGSTSVPLFVQDVMTTANTDQGSTGEYSGKGIMSGDFNFSVNSGKDYGMFLVLSSLVPKIGYYQGSDRNNFALTKLDFYQPEFDGLGTQAIKSMELYTPMDGNYLCNDGIRERVFGFSPFYAHLKCAKDWVTGDFVLDSKNTAGMSSNAWHLLRDFDQVQYQADATSLVHNYSFVYGDDADQYNRIFNNTSSAADHFAGHFTFRVTDYKHARPLYDTYDFDDSQGKDVLIDVNGGSVN